MMALKNMFAKSRKLWIGSLHNRQQLIKQHKLTIIEEVRPQQNEQLQRDTKESALQ